MLRKPDTHSRRTLPMPRIAYIMSTNFAGSTLLNALLDRHPDVTALNELLALV